ncbi:MAG: PspA/IM30 family protein [Thiotrichales bacterium]|nr:PspA/IM30 family protein [Thiotrichales bacterium]
MQILRDIMTAIRGGASEVGESIIDHQAIRILEQEIRDAREAIAKSKLQLTKLKAREMKLAKQINTLQGDEKKYIQAARDAMAAGNTDLATEIAERISTIRNDKADLEKSHATLKKEVNAILKAIQKRESQIDDNETELQKAKTVEEIQKTRQAISSSLPTTSNSAARVQKAMERVKQRHQDFEDNEAAGEWLADAESGSDLDKKIDNAGLGAKKTSAEDILKELA